MKKDILARVIREANYMLETKKTIREVAKVFKVSKSTVHKDLNERLATIDKCKYTKIMEILNEHIKIRHIRGGASTKAKYAANKN